MKIEATITSIKVEKMAFGIKHYILEAEGDANTFQLNLDPSVYDGIYEALEGIEVEDKIEIILPGEAKYDD